MDKSPLWFFLPALDGSIHAVLQISFAAVFLVAMLVTPLKVARFARAEHWERRRLAIEQRSGQEGVHVSADELSAAVATPAERWADILPSLLLVFGLLGTFIGLGLALTEAASVLGGGNDALGGLTPIMDSLGSKFKTSTWGIFAFLTLKIWFMARPYEEERMIWAGNVIKSRLALENAEIEQRRTADWQRLIETITASSANQVAEQQRIADRAAEQHEISQAALQSALTSGLNAASEQRGAIGEQHGRTLAAIAGALTQASAQNNANNQQQVEALSAIRGQLEQADVRREAVVATAVERILESSREQVAQTTLCVERLDVLKVHTEASRLAMDSFVEGVRDNITTMAQAANNMAHAAEGTGKASQALGTVINDLRDTMIGVLSDMRSGLTDSIKGMEGTFTTNMQSMADSLSRATQGIEEAISHLSSGVTETITTLDKASQGSLELQRRAQAAFAGSSDELRSSMITMQDFVKEMQEKTQTGLTSVATAGRRMELVSQKIGELDQRYGESNLRMKSVADSMDALLEGMSEQAQSLIQAGERHERQLLESARLVEQVGKLHGDVVKLVDAQSRFALTGEERKERLLVLERHVAAILAALTDTQEIPA